MKKNKKRSFNRMSIFRLGILLGLTLLAFGIVIIRLGYLQIVDSEKLKKYAVEQWTTGIDVKPKRGVIYDRNGKKMAFSVNAYTLECNPEEVKINGKKNHNEVAKVLTSTLEGVNKKTILDQLNSGNQSIKIKQWLTNDEKTELEKLMKEKKIYGLLISEGSKRFYPNKDFASYVLGFTNIDNVGLNGIELTYNTYLSGESGKVVRDGSGRSPDDSRKTYDPEDGYNIVLTLDETIQRIVEESAKKALEETKADNISILVMDPNNGDILAMANNPSYDPNNPRTPSDPALAAEWENLLPEELEEKWYALWRNYSISDIYEPGSTFKTIMAAAAIEENVANPETNFYCSGFIRDIPGEVLKCSRWYKPHYHINLEDGLSESCNVVFVDVGRKLGKEKTLKYIKAFGFGENTGIELLGEQSGIIPNKPDDMRDINLATISYGHGIAVTPIQLLNSIATISNGGNLMQPRLVSKILDSNDKVVESIEPEIKRRVISESTSETMLKMMESVVAKGTGGNAYVPGYKVAGKTGTADKIVDGMYVPGKYIASFVSVAPADDPKIAMLVIVDDPEGLYYGGSVAAPIAADIIEKIMSYMEIEPKYTEEEKVTQDELYEVPYLIDMTLEDAGELIIKSGYKYNVDSNITSEKTRVIKQYPKSGEKLEKGGIIDLYLEEKASEGIQVPNLSGLSKEDAINKLEELGIKYKIIGEGVVKSQKPEPGKVIERNTIVEVEFIEKMD